MQINQAALTAITKGYRVLFFDALHGAKPQWPIMAMRAPSTAGAEVYHWLGALPGMRELLGEAVVQNLTASNWTISNKEWEMTVEVGQKEIERDSYGLYNPLMQAMGQSAAEHPDELSANLLINGFTANDYTGGPFFSATHKHRVGGAVTFNNLGTKKFSADNFATARAAIKGLTNEHGRPMNLGNNLLLIVSPTYEKTARDTVIADTAANGASNTNKGTANLLVWPRLAGSPHKWFLLDVGSPIKPIIFQDEKAVQLLTTANGMTTEALLATHKYLYQAYGRYNAGYGLPHLAWGSTGADAA